MKKFRCCKNVCSKSDQNICAALSFCLHNFALIFLKQQEISASWSHRSHHVSSSFHQKFLTSLTDITREKYVHRSFKSSFELISWLKVISTTRSHHLTWRHHCCFKSSVHTDFRVSGSELSFVCQVSVTLEKSFCGKLTLNCFLNHGAIMWRYHALKQLIDFDAQNHKCKDIVIIALLLCLFSMLGSNHIVQQ